MIVTRNSFAETLACLRTYDTLSLDTETTGLRPYHGDRLFSVIIGIPGEFDDPVLRSETAFYFNFQADPGLQPEAILLPEHLRVLQGLFSDPSKTWYAHNAKFDLAMLAREGLEVMGEIHCTQAIERVVYNDHPPGSYDLDSCAGRIGFAKDPAVEKYIDEQELWSWSPPEKPGMREKLLHFDRVPAGIIVPYGERDANITLRLARHQEESLRKTAAETPAGLPTVLNIFENEKRLTRTLFRMERVGVNIDRPYCVRAAAYEADRAQKAKDSFKRETGRDFLASPKLFSEIFASERERWEYTEKGNPSFESDVLKKFNHPAARSILQYRDAKSRSDFYRGFLWFADADDVVHPNWNPGGAATGRFSSNGPNFQNLTSEEDEELDQEFVVRRAIIPREGFQIYGRDYNQMEYVLAVEYAAIIVGYETEMVRRIRNGEDVHQATADIVTYGGTPLLRNRAKNANFAFLFGSGYDTLAATCGCTRQEAIALKTAISSACPELQLLVDTISATARTRGFIRNWAGRRSYLKDTAFAYKMLNYLIQGGCADVNKFALNRIDELLRGRRSRLVMTIHDEAVLELAHGEDDVPALVKEAMETVYTGKYLNLTTSGYRSTRSLADLENCT